MADFTTQSEVEDVLSEAGVRLHLDDDESGGLNAAELAVLTEDIQVITEDMESYLGHWYSNSTLSASALIRKWASYLVAAAITMRRGNAKVFCDKEKEIRDRLKQIAAGDTLPNLKHAVSPSISSSVVHISHRYPLARARVVSILSTTQTNNLHTLRYIPIIEV